MATITRTAASSEAVEAARKNTFSAGYGFSNNQILIIEDIVFVQHTIKGIETQTACPIIKLQGSSEVIYLRSLIKERYDFQNKLQEVTGTFNKKLLELSGKTIGEVVDTLTKEFKGKSLKALRKTYMGVNRAGEIQPISYNEFDIN